MQRSPTRRRRSFCGVTVLLMVMACGASPETACAIDFPGAAPGPAVMQRERGRVIFSNAAIQASWDLAAGRPGTWEVTDKATGATARLDGEEPFVISLSDGRTLKASSLRPAGAPVVEPIAARTESVRLAGRFAGWRLRVAMVSADSRVRVDYEATLRDQSNYVRQQLTISSTEAIAGGELQFAAVAGRTARVLGTVDGSPVVAEPLFFACEHPMAKASVAGDRFTISLRRFRPIEPGRPWTVSRAAGVAPEGQLRRAFLYYLERERARPYRPLCYYISWFDIAAPNLKMNERQCLDVIDAVGREMVARRGVKLDAFVFDDGWDDNATLWQFHAGFPHGFTPLQKAAAGYGAFLGTWISPFGGYGQPRRERLEYGKSQGFETNRSGFSLAGPKYYQRFSTVCAEMVRRYGVGYLKFDGIGAGAFSDGPGDDFGPDMEALLRLLDDLRTIKADLFMNTTTGTWPSPFWLWHSDTVWRGGRDVGYSGPGSKRQQWMTYRDGIGYRIRTQRGPLYPFNSLKFQSVMCARLSLAAELGNAPREVIDDIRMAAGSGTQLQEFFITPSMLAPEVWEAMAEAVGWVRQNADVLVDSHGIGGDPAQGEPYGFASWSPRLGILVLRNPSDRPAAFSVDLAEAFELSSLKDAPTRYALQSPWREAKHGPELIVEVGRKHGFPLAPFEVATFEARAAGPSHGAAAQRTGAASHRAQPVGLDDSAPLFPSPTAYGPLTTADGRK